MLWQEPLSTQLLRWIQERIPADDAMRIKSFSSYKEIQPLGKGRFGEVIKYLNTSKMVHETVKRVPMELFDHWSQSDYRISQARCFPFTAIDALKALNYLHTLDPPVVHRDIKAANLLLTISDSVKLANFGLVRDLAIDGFGIAVASDITLDFRGEPERD
nr:Serine threonine protein kinase-related domain containing protein [Haemonchus contortus]